MTARAVLDQNTEKLVDDFASALKAKLLASQRKYGWSDNWSAENWREACQSELLRHLGKGDPVDVAAYCAFLWFHGWPRTAPTGAKS